MMHKNLNRSYLIIQGFVALITLVFLRGMFDALMKQVGGLIFVDAGLLMAELGFGCWFVIKNLKHPEDRNMKMMTYLPFLLFVEGGILATLGLVLMMIAIVMRYKYPAPLPAKVKVGDV